jgi:hypothetical protein
MYTFFIYIRKYGKKERERFMVYIITQLLLRICLPTFYCTYIERRPRLVLFDVNEFLFIHSPVLDFLLAQIDKQPFVSLEKRANIHFYSTYPGRKIRHIYGRKRSNTGHLRTVLLPESRSVVYDRS